MKFTKIRKWAKDKGYKLTDVQGYSGKPCIHVQINENLYFKIEERDSTIYQSVKGQRGSRKGTYLTSQHTGRRYNGSISYDTQPQIIEQMEREINW